MKSRINFTMRQKIRQSDISITVNSDPGNPFQITLEHLDDYSFRKNSLVVIEVTSSGNYHVQRWELEGTLGEHLRRNRKEFPDGGVLFQGTLPEFQAKNFLFTIKIVDTSEEIGKILGIAHVRVRKEEDTLQKKTAIISEKADLGPELWKVKVDRNFGVSLLWNQKYPTFPNELNTNRKLQAILLPVILRTALLQLGLEGLTEEEDVEEENQLQYFWNFAKKYSSQEPPSSENSEEYLGWVDAVVEEYSRQKVLGLEEWEKS